MPVQARGHWVCWEDGAAGLAHVLVQQVLEDRAVALEAGGVDVGEVVRNDRHARLLRIEAGLGNPQSWFMVVS